MPDQPSPHVRLELRIAGEPLAWYHEDDLAQASAHLDAVVSHPDASALAQVVRVVPGSSDVVLLSSVPRGAATPHPGSAGSGAA